MIHSHDLIKNRILVVGANGMLGQRLVDYFSGQRNVELLASSVEEVSYNDPSIPYMQIDMTRRESVKNVVYDFYPDYIINAAAFTNVDLCEKERETAWKVNVKGVEYLAETSRIIDTHLIHISTDYVFDGKNGPYSEDAKPNPLGYYGRTKLASENALRLIGATNTIIRTNVLYGPVKNGRADFVRWVVNSLREGKEIRIVTDQINNPTYLDDLVDGISRVIEFRRQGIFNIGGKEFLSRYDFTLRIAEFFRLDKNLIKPVKTCDLKQTAPRPLKSGLVILKAETSLGYKPRSVQDTFVQMKKELDL
ncbi:MAG TPA: dTDP-4-dehydrorhamnose reductase [Ignavibacteriales bacterium]|nr:dTDP-4-dehydrorhamnose reductase [Ignavibacteriales bacterium]